MSKDIKLAPSILSADFSSLGHQITEFFNTISGSIKELILIFFRLFELSKKYIKIQIKL